MDAILEVVGCTAISFSAQLSEATFQESEDASEELRLKGSVAELLQGSFVRSGSGGSQYQDHYVNHSTPSADDAPQFGLSDLPHAIASVQIGGVFDACSVLDFLESPTVRTDHPNPDYINISLYYGRQDPELLRKTTRRRRQLGLR